MSRISPRIQDSDEVKMTSRHQPAIPQRQKLRSDSFNFPLYCLFIGLVWTAELKIILPIKAETKDGFPAP